MLQNISYLFFIPFIGSLWRCVVMIFKACRKIKTETKQNRIFWDTYFSLASPGIKSVQNGIQTQVLGEVKLSFLDFSTFLPFLFLSEFLLLIKEFITCPTSDFSIFSQLSVQFSYSLWLAAISRKVYQHFQFCFLCFEFKTGDQWKVLVVVATKTEKHCVLWTGPCLAIMVNIV